MLQITKALEIPSQAGKQLDRPCSDLKRLDTHHEFFGTWPSIPTEPSLAISVGYDSVQAFPDFQCEAQLLPSYPPFRDGQMNGVANVNIPGISNVAARG